MNYELRIKKIKNKGFTIIETMVSVSIFLIVVTIGMNALLNVSLIHKKSANMRSILDSLSFIMEDMSRNLRTGYNYHCGNIIDGGVLIAFESANGKTTNASDQWVYKIKDNRILKSIDSGNKWIQLNPDEVSIDGQSFFIVSGSIAPNSDGSGDHQQPFVTIKLSGTITDPQSNVVTPFSLETSVSQRLIDVYMPPTP